MGGEDRQFCETETHVLIFPCSAQGHVTCMLQLAQLLALSSNIHVTFLRTEHICHRLLRFADLPSRFAAYPTLHFETFSYGLPADDPRHGDNLGELIKQVNLHFKPHLRKICLEPSGKPRLSRIIGDGILDDSLMKDTCDRKVVEKMVNDLMMERQEEF